jgi:hypothetical protein
MSCDTRLIGFLHLGGDSHVHVKSCSLTRGSAALHEIEVRNYALVDVQVRVECKCPDGGALEYPTGQSWTSNPVRLARGRSWFGVKKHAFKVDLTAPIGGSGTTSEQIELTACARRHGQRVFPPAGPPMGLAALTVS